MDLSFSTFEIIDNVAVIKMNNPPVNAMTPIMLDEFTNIIDTLNRPGKVRALVLASDCPGFFSAGDDVTKLKEIDEKMIELLPKVHKMMNDFEALPIPTVAAINGHALGGGLELALTCDFRFMAEDSGRIGLPEVRLGMIPAFGGTQRLPLIIGKAKAIEMMYKGLQVTPEEAKSMHLVTNTFSKETLFEKSFDYARRLALQATGAIRRIKQCVHTGLYEGFEKGLAMEIKTFNDNIFSPDAREGIDAFLSGKKPEFKG